MTGLEKEDLIIDTNPTWLRFRKIRRIIQVLGTYFGFKRVYRL